MSGMGKGNEQDNEQPWWSRRNQVWRGWIKTTVQYCVYVFVFTGCVKVRSWGDSWPLQETFNQGKSLWRTHPWFWGHGRSVLCEILRHHLLLFTCSLWAFCLSCLFHSLVSICTRIPCLIIPYSLSIQPPPVTSTTLSPFHSSPSSLLPGNCCSMPGLFLTSQWFLLMHTLWMATLRTPMPRHTNASPRVPTLTQKVST